MLHLFFGIGLSLCVPTLAVPTKTAVECTREGLKEIADSYVTAQTTGQVASLRGLADTITYIESDKKLDIKTGILAKAFKIDHTRHSLDTVACATYTELIIANGATPHVIGTQIRLADGKVTQIESMITDKDDWLFNATGTLNWASKEDWFDIPAEKRDSREVIKAAADAYLDVFHDKSAAARNKIPWGTPCARLEGGAYTGRGTPTDSCDVGVPTRTTYLTNRRYVLDEVKGAVDVFLNFGGPSPTSRGPPDSHEFRLEGGKLRYVHTMTVSNGLARLP